jgi:hypothetical protein
MRSIEIDTKKWSQFFISSRNRGISEITVSFSYQLLPLGSTSFGEILDIASRLSGFEQRVRGAGESEGPAFLSVPSAGARQMPSA